MSKPTTLTVRVPAALKRKIGARAAREHRSVSSQVEHELQLAFADEPERTGSAGSFVGLFAGRRMPCARDFDDVRALLWGELGKRRG
jgi:hypothetical protein